MNMQIKSMTQICCVAIGMMALGGTFARAATIQLTPSSLPIALGGTSGFGFTFVNDSDGYAVFNDTALAQLSAGYGLYTDFIGSQNDLVIAAPGATVTQIYNQASGSGAGSYSFLSGAPGGVKVTGTLSLFYDVFSVDPNAANFNSLTDYIDSREVSSSVELTVIAAPEPNECGMVGAALLILGVARKYRVVLR